MKLQDLSKEQIDEMAMIDIASMILESENKALDFRDIFDRVAELKGFSESEKDAWISQYYTDLNIDGRFLTKGSNLWGLKKWYPVEDIDEDITVAPKRKKKKAKKKKKQEEEEVLDETEDLDETIVGAVEDLHDLDDDDELVDDDLEDDDFNLDDEEDEEEIEGDIDDEFTNDDDLEK
ncbi:MULTISPECIES: DNA-directed RNA polymerase subunit delta [Gracilibacillus]|uniref:DNA-directed RNA polymerase subunit delta n=1 Tax=Gracilibacillus TaxID=74385 RepID=UPI000825FEDF|nr:MULTISPECIES: DNA-directed RNA polymerase subunit delta [Gracilibacillus]